MSDTKNMVDCQVFGVDISENAVNNAKSYGIDVFKGSINNSPFPNNYFDVITAWSYLEHINNPSEALTKIFNILKNEGFFIFICPNYNSFNAKIFKDKWYHLDCPRHLYIYSPQTISESLIKTGFSVEKIDYEKSSKGLLGSLQYFFYDNNFEPLHKDKIRHSSLLKAILSPLARINYLARKADTMLVIAKKSKNEPANYQQ